MKRTILLLIILNFQLLLTAQSWQPLQGGLDGAGRVLFTDTITNKLFVGGNFQNVNGHSDFGISVWNGSVWDTIYGLSNLCIEEGLGFARYQNELYAIGEIGSSLNNHLLGSFTSWTGTEWDSLNKSFNSYFGCNYNGIPWNSCEYDNKLYIIGGFDTVGDYYSPGITAWNGTNWIQFGLPNYESNSNGDINTCSVFQNDLYIAGNFADTVGNLIGCAKFDGTNWTEVGMEGGGLVFCSAVYNNELYIGGHYLGQNSANLVKYDGVNFTDVNFTGRVDNLKVIDNKLFAVIGSLGIYYADNVPIPDHIAVWDGSNWSDFSNDTIQGGLSDITVFQNQIYVTGTFTAINSDTGYNNIARYNGYFVGENNIQKKIGVKVYPNPASNKITFSQSGIRDYELRITDVLGRAVYKTTLSGDNNSITISDFSNGVYFYQLTNSKETVRGKFVKE